MRRNDSSSFHMIKNDYSVAKCKYCQSILCLDFVLTIRKPLDFLCYSLKLSAGIKTFHLQFHAEQMINKEWDDYDICVVVFQSQLGNV